MATPYVNTVFDTAFTANAGLATYDWIDVGADQDILRMIQITSDATGAAFAGTSLGPVLLTSSYTLDCEDWITKSGATATVQSLPLQLYDAGYEVYLGCRRGSTNSRPDTITTPATYWDVSTIDYGTTDIPAMVDQILSGTTCTGVQIIGDGTGAAEALIAANASGVAADSKVSQLIALTPCLVPTYLSSNSSHRRLDDMTNLDGDIRELHETFMSERERELSVGEPAGRELSHTYFDNYNTTYRSSYWDRTERYCDYYAGSCYSYCDWYPSHCNEFCYWFPEYCQAAVPAEVTNQCNLLTQARALMIYSFYGADWATEVTSLCTKVSYSQCADLKASIGQGYKEVSLKQFELMFQQAYTGEFDSFDADFCTTGYASATTDISLAGISVNVASFYL